MDDQMNQGMPGSMPDSPLGGSPMGGGMGSMGGTPPPMGGMASEDPHEKIMAALQRIEEKLAAIAAKVGA